jgi:hypothetical protein
MRRACESARARQAMRGATERRKQHSAAEQRRAAAGGRAAFTRACARKARSSASKLRTRRRCDRRATSSPTRRAPPPPGVGGAGPSSKPSVPLAASSRRRSQLAKACQRCCLGSFGTYRQGRAGQCVARASQSRKRAALARSFGGYGGQGRVGAEGRVWRAEVATKDRASGGGAYTMWDHGRVEYHAGAWLYTPARAAPTISGAPGMSPIHSRLVRTRIALALRTTRACVNPAGPVGRPHPSANQRVQRASAGFLRGGLRARACARPMRSTVRAHGAPRRGGRACALR